MAQFIILNPVNIKASFFEGKKKSVSIELICAFHQGKAPHTAIESDIIRVPHYSAKHAEQSRLFGMRITRSVD